MNVIKKFDNNLILELDNKTTLGLNIGLSNRGTAGTEFSEIRKRPGFILKGNVLEEFNLPEITEIDDKIIIYSNSLSSGINPLFTSDNDLVTIKEVVRFFTILKDKGIELTTYSRNLLYKTDDGNLIMLPPDIIEFINERDSLAKKLSNQSIFKHPDLKSEQSLLYSIGILIFEHTTDGYPIVYSDVEDLRDKMRRKKLIKPRWKNVKLNDDICKLIEDLLDSELELTLNQILPRLEKLLKDGIFRDDINLEDEILQNDRLKNKMIKAEEHRRFLIKNKGLLIGVGIGIMILVTFFGTIISNALKPPKTVGFSEQQVIETYFAAFQTLDPELIDDVLKKGVRKNDSTEISTLYVTVKMRTQNDATAQMVTPAEWLTLDDVQKSNTDVYGIYNLEIDPLNDISFTVHYEKWFTQPENDDISAEYIMEVQKLIKDEIFTMEKTKYSYVISKIETISERSEKVW